MRWARVLLAVMLAAVIGLTIFGTLAVRHVTVESANAGRAADRFAHVHAEYPGGPALRIELDAEGRAHVVPRGDPPHGDRPSRLRVLAYRVRDDRLAEADVPYWFVRLKRPALAFALRRTGVDLDALGLSGAELDAHGPGILIDREGRDGDRVMVWLE